MRSAPMITIRLEELVEKLQADPLAFNAHWVVYCEACDKEYRIWPDRGGLVCASCQVPLVALVAMS